MTTEETSKVKVYTPEQRAKKLEDIYNEGRNGVQETLSKTIDKFAELNGVGMMLQFLLDSSRAFSNTVKQILEDPENRHFVDDNLFGDTVKAMHQFVNTVDEEYKKMVDTCITDGEEEVRNG